MVKRRLSSTIEDYLQSIYSLETEGERVISARLARWMRVSPPTAWATVQRMQRDGLINLDAQKTVHLTPQGRDLAASVAGRPRPVASARSGTRDGSRRPERSREA